jgi:hypothetical protein
VTIDVRDVLERADLLNLALVDTALRRVGKERHGACPFCTCSSTTSRKHQCDRFRVDAEGRHWFCRHCSPQGGNAIDYAIKRYQVPFKQACYIALGGQRPPLAPRVQQRRTAPELPSATWQARGRQLIADAIAALWSPTGVRALEYLHGRGLTGHTITAWQLGYIAAGAKLPGVDWGFSQDKDIYLHRGILIPWFTSTGALAALKIRKPVPTTERNKYASVTGSTYRLFGSGTVLIDEPLVLTEGEFDAIAAWQVLGEQAATVALGTARVPDASELRLLCCARPVLVALDADETGDQVAQQVVALSDNCRRARPIGAKDLSKCVEIGADLRTWFDAAMEEDA